MALPGCNIYRSVKNAVLSSPVSSARRTVPPNLSERGTNLSRRSHWVFSITSGTWRLTKLLVDGQIGPIYNIGSTERNKA